MRACSLQSYICTRWTRLLSGWTGYFSAALDGCASGLSSQDAHQRGCRSGFCLTQGPENCNRPGSARYQSHSPSDWTLYVQPHCVGAPPLAHDDGDERGHDNRDTIPFLDAPILSGSLFGPAVEGFAECFTEAQKSSQAMQHLTHQLFFCFQSPQICADLADSQTSTNHPGAPTSGREVR